MDLAWPSEWSYSGDRANTIWAINEKTIMDISYMIMIFGLVLITLAVTKYLFVENE